jgi:hypothetical protein
MMVLSIPHEVFYLLPFVLTFLAHWQLKRMVDLSLSLLMVALGYRVLLLVDALLLGYGIWYFCQHHIRIA